MQIAGRPSRHILQLECVSAICVTRQGHVRACGLLQIEVELREQDRREPAGVSACAERPYTQREKYGGGRFSGATHGEIKFSRAFARPDGLLPGSAICGITVNT